MIHFNEVEKHFDTITALSHITCQMGSGEVIALVGANGAGKTTLLRLVVGLTSPDRGTVLVDDLSPIHHGVEVRRRISYMPDIPFLAPVLTGLEQLQFHADIYRQPEALERAWLLADAYHMTDALNRPTAAYSRGMQQKLALIRALMINAPIFLLDEPFNALDPPAVVLLQSHLQERARQGRIVVVSSHLLSVLQDVAQRILVLKGGALLYADSLTAIDWKAHLSDWFDQTTDVRGDEE